MKSFFNFIKTTIYGGILFIIPFTIIYYIFKDVYNNLYKIVAPIAISAGVESFFGKVAVIIIVIIVLLIICFLLGLIVKFGFGKKLHDMLDKFALTFIPGYDKMKAETIKKVDKKLLDKAENVYDQWKSVIMKLNLEWKIVFIVEETENGFITIFEPGSPEFLKGGTKIISKNDVVFFHIEKSKAISYLKKYGTGSTELLAGKEFG